MPKANDVVTLIGKSALVFGVAAFGVVIFGIFNRPNRPKHHNFYSEADSLVAEKVTNDLTGWRRTLSIYVKREDLGDPSTWTATADAEFINALGGVERTNLYYRFLTFTNTDGERSIFCNLDHEKHFHEWLDHLARP
jgi:hypothetical protein